MLRRYAKKALHHFKDSSYTPLNRIELDRARLLHNFQYIQSKHPSDEIIPVLKGNAYGHGLEQIAEILNEAPCRMLAVDGYFEAARLRDVSKHHFLVMGYILPVNVRLLDTKRCSFVVQDIASLEAFGKLKRPVRVWLELNTGMNRMGLQPDELDTYLQTIKHYPNLELEGVMSHLADADNKDSYFTERQIQEFDKHVQEVLSAGFEPRYISLAQTAGSTKAQSSHANAIRLGIGLYGINPLQPDDLKYQQLQVLKPVLELKSTVIKVISLQKGDKVSYNGIFTAPRNMQIGVLPLGYYEGLPRELSNVGFVTYHDKPLPIVGRICMNHTMIDISTTDLMVGSEVTVISKNTEASSSIDKRQIEHKLFPYDELTRLSSTIRRGIV
jgi:alanine racemase